jgi:UDP-3-O-[3-hydroxymyristoyl] glucosamine N-acyltransferase
MQIAELSKLEDSFKLIKGDPSIDVERISHSEFPEKNSFIFLKSKKYLNALNERHGDAVFSDTGLIIEEKFLTELSGQADALKGRFKWVASITDVNAGMSKFSKPFYESKFNHLNYHLDGRQTGSCDIDPNAEIAQNVFIGENVVIGAGTIICPGAVIMPEVTIGKNTIIFPNVTLYPYTSIGNETRIHAGVTIGADGFGYNFFDGAHQKVWHFSGVEIGDQVEIGSSSTVDSGAFIPTRVGNGTKVDNGVQIGHNAQIGNNCVLCGQVAIAGSVFMDDYVVFGGRAGSAPNSKIGKGAQIAAMSALAENAVIEPGATMAGYPARPLKEWLKTQAAIRKLIK